MKPVGARAYDHLYACRSGLSFNRMQMDGSRTRLKCRTAVFWKSAAKLPTVMTIDWSFNNSAPLESNVHFHERKQVIYPAKHAAASSVKDRLIVKAEQDICCMQLANAK